jgi:hypothetical protein
MLMVMPMQPKPSATLRDRSCRTCVFALPRFSFVSYASWEAVRGGQDGWAVWPPGYRLAPDCCNRHSFDRPPRLSVVRHSPMPLRRSSRRTGASRLLERLDDVECDCAGANVLTETATAGFHSVRNATIGSTLDTWRAGTAVATAAASTRSIGAATNVNTSRPLIP